VNSPQKSCVLNLLEEQLQKNPKAIAIAAPDRQPLTYQQLYTHLKEMKAVLQAYGVGPQDRVVLVLPNGPEMAVAFLTIASMATCAPLNPAYRADEFDFFLEDLNAKVLIIQKDMDSSARDIAQARGIHIIELTPKPEIEAGLFTLNSKSPSHPSTLVRETVPGDVALVLHTSGTTSRPKLVPLTHSNLLTSAANIVASLHLNDQDRCLNIMPLFHIHGLVGALLSSLAAGGSVVCTPGFQPGQIVEWMKEFSPTWYSAVPTMHQGVLDEASLRPDWAKRSGLRLIRSSSASLPPSVMQKLERTFHCPVIEAYGMTEAAHQMASNPLPPRARKPGSVGKAAGPEIGIINEKGNLMPLGKTGEIAIRGCNVMESYVNNPAANEGAFSQGWFRTGDEGYLDTEGYLFLTGRLKEMINRGGEKIAPREVEEVLLGHQAVAQAVVFGMPHPTLGEDVAAAMVLKTAGEVTERELQNYMSEHVAEFKVPRRIVEVEELPKGPTGKLQRIGMAERLGLTHTEESAVGSKSDVLLPFQDRNEEPSKMLATVVASIFAKVLSREQVGIHENFFEIGGDSIRAAQIANRIQALLPLDLNAVVIFRQPTVAELSQEILASMDQADRSRIGEFLAQVR